MIKTYDHLKYGDITGQAIKCGYHVHDYFGSGYPEIVYKRSLIIDFIEIGLNFKYEEGVDIYYKEHSIYNRRVDFLLNDQVLLEVKAIKEITPAEINQVLNYLKVHKFEIGLLFNFGMKEFFFKRFIHKET